jgi:hypothetical protein
MSENQRLISLRITLSVLLGYKAVYYETWILILEETTEYLGSIQCSTFLRHVGSNIPDNTELQSGGRTYVYDLSPLQDS